MTRTHITPIPRGARLALIALVAAAQLASAQTRGPQMYSLRMMGSLRLSVPVTEDGAQVRYRDARNRWVALPGTIRDGVATVDLSPAAVPEGRTLLLVGVPANLNLDDSTPPRVSSITIDGEDYGPRERLDLGGVDALPRRITIELADDQSALRRSTLRVAANGRPLARHDAGLKYAALGSRRARVDLDVPALLGEGTRHNTITLSIDDYALDDNSLDLLISFTQEQPYTLPDGTIARVDSVTGSGGWEQWWVIFDGHRMDGSGGTTAGKTWLSEANRLPHWLRLDFPQPRTVSRVAIAWGYWESFRTSQHYQVQALIEGRWVTVVDALGATPTQESTHVFTPVTTSAVRLWQPAMMGAPAEPQYIWLSEFEAR